MYVSCNILGDINDRENVDYYINYFFKNNFDCWEIECIDI